MAQVKKFSLIPEEFVIKHTVSNKRLTELDKLMIKILNSNLPDHEKLARYHEVLQTSLNLQEFNHPMKETHAQEQSISTQVPVSEKNGVQEIKVEKEDNDYHDLILAAIPKSKRSAAEHVLALIKKQPKVLSYNDRGEIILHDQRIENSNIIDMIKYIFNSRVAVSNKNTYHKAISDLNIPQSLITNRKLFEKNQDIVPMKKLVRKKKPVLNKNPITWDNF